MISNTSSSQYIEQERREYALYTLSSRALPHLADGLKPVARRILWIAKSGSKNKSATLAGATMPIHPHGDASICSAINTLAAPYGNNVCLLDGHGAFGTLLNPTAYGASRYTSVQISQFTKDVVFKDIEIVPLQDNYDGTHQEPVHFLPLVPLVLVNPQEGIAVGFASKILPYDLKDVITSQLQYLDGKTITIKYPKFVATQQYAKQIEANKFQFQGKFEKINSTTLKITQLPYGVMHQSYIDLLNDLQEQQLIKQFEDNSKDTYDIVLKITRSTMAQLKTDQDILDFLQLNNTVTQNFNVINFDGQTVTSPDYKTTIQQFCDWRIKWYTTRYQRLKLLIETDIQKYKDIITAINRNVGATAKKVDSRAELKQLLQEYNIINVDYVADLPVYKFTQQEKQKVQQKLKDSEKQLKHYNQLLKSKTKITQVFKQELQEVLHQYNQGKYTHHY